LLNWKLLDWHKKRRNNVWLKNKLGLRLRRKPIELNKRGLDSNRKLRPKNNDKSKQQELLRSRDY
jgi:hypothetical protein